MIDFETIAYGLRETTSGRTSIVRVVARLEAVRIGDLVGTRRAILHRGIASYAEAAIAEHKARGLAALEDVPYVGYKADTQ